MSEDRKTILQKYYDYAQIEFDKLLVYLSSGALVLTVGFVKDVAKITPKTDTTLLIWSWSLFASSLIINLLSHKSAFLSIYQELKTNGNIKLSDVLDLITEVLNWISFASLVAGIILFIIFTTNNL